MYSAIIIIVQCSTEGSLPKPIALVSIKDKNETEGASMSEPHIDKLKTLYVTM